MLGVDFGIKELATCSDGSTFINPRALVSNLNKLKRKQRQFSRKKKDSKNREKDRKKLAKFYFKISNIRKDCLHKTSTSIVQKANVIVLEDLKISSMLKNRHIARVLSDTGLCELRRQIEYKAKWFNTKIILAGTYYPSSKLCSKCGRKNDSITLADRVFRCKQCGYAENRDLNASFNLKAMYTASLTGINASGDGEGI